jgi:hypothetical protein
MQISSDTYCLGLGHNRDQFVDAVDGAGTEVQGRIPELRGRWDDDGYDNNTARCNVARAQLALRTSEGDSKFCKYDSLYASKRRNIMAIHGGLQNC